MMVSEPNTGNSMTAANVSGQMTAMSATLKLESDMGLVFIGFGVGNADDEMANVPSHRHRTAGATDAGSEATKHPACQRVGVRWTGLFAFIISSRDDLKQSYPTPCELNQISV